MKNIIFLLLISLSWCSFSFAGDMPSELFIAEGDGGSASFTPVAIDSHLKLSALSYFDFCFRGDAQELAQTLSPLLKATVFVASPSVVHYSGMGPECIGDPQPGTSNDCFTLPTHFFEGNLRSCDIL